MDKVLYKLFGVVKPKETKQEMVDTVKSTFPNNPISYDVWCKEFNVSLLYDRKINHIEQNF
jgi:hypothetical protein